MTIACAMIGRHLRHMDDYMGAKASLTELARKAASVRGFEDCHVEVNAADDEASDRIYLTVTGTSADAGDDGQVGRGNRVSGVISPGRPMSLEAATRDGLPVDVRRGDVEDIVVDHLDKLGTLVDGFIAGTIDVF